MSGQPLREAQRCAEHVVGRLRPTDSVSLVQFDNRVQRLWSAVPLGDGVALRAAIAGIEAGGNTHLHGGWKEGADSLSDIAGQGLKRVILLSDGQANEGLTDHDAISAQCADWAARGITTSTYGLGRAFNEDLMVAMARAGGGNHYYGETAEDLMDPFQQELELLDNLCMCDMHLNVKVADGVTCELLNALPSKDGGWRLPDIAWGAEAWAVLRLKVPVASLPACGSRLSLLQVSVAGRSLQGETVQLERAALALPVLSAAEHDGLADDELVSRRLTEIAAAQALKGLRAAATRGDWAQVDGLLTQAHRQFAGNAWVAAVLASMTSVAASRARERLSKEAMYSSEKLVNRLASKLERLSASGPVDDAELPAYLRRKPAQGKGQL